MSQRTRCNVTALLSEEMRCQTEVNFPPEMGYTPRRERLKLALYLRLKKRKTFFLENLKYLNFSLEKCRTVPKNVKGGPFLIYKHAF